MNRMHLKARERHALIIGSIVGLIAVLIATVFAGWPLWIHLLAIVIGGGFCCGLSYWLDRSSG